MGQSPTSGQIEFKDPLSPLHYKINIHSKELWKETNKGNWINYGKLYLGKIDSNQLPINPTFYSFYSKGQIFLFLDGTGQVYNLNLLEKRFYRMDKTFHRGYNFESIKFLRNDTLFSFGGVGFWHANNVETYFSTKSLEWELSDNPSDNGPMRIRDSFGGYDSKRDVISVIEFPALYSSTNKPFKYKYFEKNMTLKKWELKGHLNIDLLMTIGLNNIRSQYFNGLFFFMDGHTVAIGDPEKNEIFQFENTQNILNANFELSEKNGILYSYIKQKVLQEGNPIKIDSMSFTKLKSKRVIKGKFYTQEFSQLELLGIVGILVVLLFLTLGIVRRKLNTKRRNEEIIEHERDQSLEMMLPDGAYHFLKLCIEHPKGFEFSSQNFTEYMGYSNYSYETQRQIRSKLIKAINAYFKVHHQMEEVITRKPAPHDKRFSIYLISEIHYDKVVNLFNT
ncbi:hypothetical protein G9H65_00065 [Cytophagaceae bacterium 50A-KIRBA]|uniref:hypothetical protein n=1 Tax=Aquirufa ecclesiirivi TaxID=2715124 RepID=UPI00140B3A56|nr:hypothetical protein [Aquirufa ecclesiirivi]NHC47713.1 hypothetical protein [Aquirufa ecclesiirivi]